MDDIDDLIDKLDAYKLDNVSHFDTMSEGLAELLGDNENEPNPKPLRIAKARKDTCMVSFFTLMVKLILVNIPSELSPILIGPGGVKVKQLEKTTGARIRIHSNNKADSTVTIQGTTDSVNLAKAQIEVMRQKLIKKSVKLNANKQNFGGKLPNSWLTNPLPGKLIDDCLLPIKCPLHENFEAEVLENDGKMFSLEDVWALEKKYKRKIGLIVDSTKTNRYYDRSEVVDRGTKFKKVPLEVPDNLTVMPFDMIHKIVDYIDNYRTTEPDKLVAIHW